MADIDLSGFWDTSFGERCVQPPLTDEMLEHAERTLGVKLPLLLVELLRVQNGGIPADAYSAFPTDLAPRSWAPDHVPLDHLVGIPRPGTPTSMTLLDTAYLLREWSIPDGFVLLSGDGHYWIALDYRRCGPAGEPSVWWVDTEFEFRESHELAPTFEAFVQGLVPAERFE